VAAEPDPLAGLPADAGELDAPPRGPRRSATGMRTVRNVVAGFVLAWLVGTGGILAYHALTRTDPVPAAGAPAPAGPAAARDDRGDFPRLVWDEELRPPAPPVPTAPAAGPTTAGVPHPTAVGRR
jgi:hypothetical protein